MEREKIRSLNNFDEQKLKKLGSDRKNWLESGNDSIISLQNDKTKILVEEVKPSRIIVSVKKILKENDNYKTIILKNDMGDSLPLFRAGQKIAITLNINGDYFTKSYVISSSPLMAANGEYHITLSKTDDIVDDYLFSSLKLNEKFVISEPFGDFYYEPLRDEKNVIAIVNDNGIIPAYAMIQAVYDGIDNYYLTLFYSAKNEKDLLFKNELKEVAEKCSKIRAFFVLSEEEKEGHLTGFVSTDKIKNYYKDGETSFFIAGNEGLLNYLNKELEVFKLPRKFIRYDNYLPKYNIKRVIKYNLGIYIYGERFDVSCYNNKTILKAIEDSGIYIPSKCQIGICGLCRSELVKGEVKIVDDKRSNADKKFNYIHPCCTYPLSDIEIIVR